MRKVIVLVLCLAFVSGCWKVRVHSPNVEGTGSMTKETNFHFFWGLTGRTVAATECQNGFKVVKVRHPWWSLILLAPFTAGIVQATSMKYECAQK